MRKSGKSFKYSHFPYLRAPANVKNIVGTSLCQRVPPGETPTQEPYDRTLISDALREALGVPGQAAQAQRRSDMDAQTRARRANQP
jgi:hypothetical protein